MKDVLFVIDTLRMGGAEKSLTSLLNALDPQVINVDLLVFEPDGVLQKDIPGWVNIINTDVVTRGMTLEFRKYIGPVVRSGHILAALDRLLISVLSRHNKNTGFSWKRIKKHIPEIGKHYDVAIGYLEGFPDFFVIDKVNADEKIGWIHIDYSGRQLTREECEYYGRFDQIVTISEVCKDAFIKRVPQVKNKIKIMENIVSADDIRKKASLAIEDAWHQDVDYHLVSVGRLDYQKGMDLAALAAAELKKRQLSFCWHIYGKGSMKADIEKLISEYGLEEYFILEGIRENPFPYMKKADLIVQPSRFEGKSIVLDEAKILGKAIVVTNYPSVKDQISNLYNGVITDISPEAIADGAERLLKDSKMRKRIEANNFMEVNKSRHSVGTFYEMIHY